MGMSSLESNNRMGKRELLWETVGLGNNHPATSSLSVLHQAEHLLLVDDKSEDLLFPFIPQKQCRHYL